MRYYSLERPVGPGTFPRPAGNRVERIENFDSKQECSEIGGRAAWGYVEYEKELPKELADRYEMIPAEKLGKSL